MNAKLARRAGLAISALAVLLLTLDAAGKLFAPEMMIANSPPLGLPDDPSFHRTLGAVLAVCIALYALPRTAVLGAVLITGFLGGTVATHLRIGSPLFSHILFGVYLGILVWLGLWLRDHRVRTMLVNRRGSEPHPQGEQL